MPAATVHTATSEPDAARVRLNLSGFASGTTGVQVTRRDLDTGQYALVRAGRLLPINSPSTDSIQLYDYEWPAGHTVEYGYVQYPDLTRYQLAAPDVYDVARPWIKHVLRPYLSRPVVVGQFSPHQHMLRSTALPVVRGSVPIGSGDVRSGRRFQLSLKLEAGERALVDSLLRAGGTWFWQVPGGDLGLPTSAYVQPFSGSERLRGRPQDGARWLDLVLDEVAPPDADLAPAAVTWSSIVTAYPTWDDVLAAYATWDAVLASVAVPSEIVTA